jgi:phage shock protein A
MSDKVNENPKPLFVQVMKQVDATQDIVFSVLLKVPMLWWHIPSLDDLSQQLDSFATQERDIVFEAKVGGRLYERWGQQTEDNDGVLFATVTTLRRPDVLMLEGTLGLGAAGLPFGVVTVALTPEGDATQVTIVHQSTQFARDEITLVMTVIWSDFLERLKNVVAAICAPVSRSALESAKPAGIDSEDPQTMLEQAYEGLQDNLIQVRQAVAQAIATEKQLEQQIQKNKDQSETWQNRANMAMQQRNEDLARQALARKEQYVQSLPELESEYVLQKEATATLRQQLIKLESDVQKAYTKTRVLIARDKAARATEKANEILANSTSDGAMAIIERIEQRVLERQVQSELARDSHATGEAE